MVVADPPVWLSFVPRECGISCVSSSSVPARHYVKYTFLKVDPAWRRLDEERRAADKREFIAACADFNTSNSFGLDDQEFVVAFETDNPADFLDLVQKLRTTESSAYTLRDTPTFSCISCSVERALGALDGAALTVTAS